MSDLRKLLADENERLKMAFPTLSALDEAKRSMAILAPSHDKSRLIEMAAAQMHSPSRLIEEAAKKALEPTLRIPDAALGLGSAASAFHEAMKEMESAQHSRILALDAQIREHLAPSRAIREALDALNAQNVEMFAQVKAQMPTFSRPELPELMALEKHFEAARAGWASQVDEALRLHRLQATMSEMSTDWLNRADPYRSIRGLAEIMTLGDYATASFDIEAVNQDARSILGDWRDNITFDATVSFDANARKRRYVDQGFDPKITEFPPEAQDEASELAGLLESGVEDDGFDEDVDTNALVHVRLTRFERLIRRFIVDAMSGAVGARWLETRISPSLVAKWRDKMAKEEAAGRPTAELIDYADFMDYVDIMTSSANWREVFKSVFDRPENVRESFQRMFMARNCVAHARTASQEDKMVVLYETRRIALAVRRSRS